MAFSLDPILRDTNFWTNPSEREEFNQRTEALTWDMCNNSPATEGVGRRSIDLVDVNQAQYIQHKLRIFCGRSFQCHSFLVRAQNVVPDIVSCRYVSVFYCTPFSRTGPSQCPRVTQIRQQILRICSSPGRSSLRVSVPAVRPKCAPASWTASRSRSRPAV